MKDRHDILKAIDEILSARDVADLQRLTALCWILEPDVDWATANATAQSLLDTTIARPEKTADNAPTS